MIYRVVLQATEVVRVDDAKSQEEAIEIAREIVGHASEWFVCDVIEVEPIDGRR